MGTIQSFWKVAVFAVAVVVVQGTGPGPVAGAEAEKTKAESQLAKTIVLGPDKRVFEITLANNPSTGYSLALKSMSPGILLLEVENKPPARQVPGAGGHMVFRFFTPLHEGNGQIVFARFRAWQFAETLTEEVYKVEIQKANGGP